MDILLLAVSGYGLYSYNLRQQALEITGASGTELAIDPHAVYYLYLIYSGRRACSIENIPLFGPPIVSCRQEDMVTGYVRLIRTGGKIWRTGSIIDAIYNPDPIYRNL